MSEKEELFEQQISSEQIFDGVILHVYKDLVILPNGKEATRELLRHSGAVAIVPITDDGNVIMERQFRYPLERVITEIPAGKLDGPDEDRLDAAKRELKEETGLIADNWENIGDYYPAAAYTSERITIYIATGLHRQERDLDEDEFINIFEEPLADLLDKVMNGEITDGKTIAGILKAARKYNI